MTTALLSALQDHGIVAVSCDDRHMPNGILLPFHQHSRVSEVAHLQREWAVPLRKRLWQQIVQQKIMNQAECLKRHQIDGESRLRSFAKKVTSGDSQNMEAQAARYYWKRLFGAEFRRGGLDKINSGLNYGYAVVRAVVSRSIVSYGLIPSFGIHHDNNLNAFNLADDLIELFRPFVDDCVKTMGIDGCEQLSTEERQQLANLSNLHCMMDGEVHTLTNASDRVAIDLVASIRTKTPSLTWPEFIISQ